MCHLRWTLCGRRGGPGSGRDDWGFQSGVSRMKLITRLAALGLNRPGRNRRKNRRGSAVLEFALGSGILMAAFSGTYPFGYTFLQYNNLENAVTRGAR